MSACSYLRRSPGSGRRGGKCLQSAPVMPGNGIEVGGRAASRCLIHDCGSLSPRSPVSLALVEDVRTYADPGGRFRALPANGAPMNVMSEQLLVSAQPRPRENSRYQLIRGPRVRGLTV